MALVALASLRETIDLEFLKPNHRDYGVSLYDENQMKFLFWTLLRSLQDHLKETPIRDLEIKIRDFALRAEDTIEMQLSNILLAKGEEDQDQAREELHYTLQQVAEDAEELLKMIKNTQTACTQPEPSSDTHHHPSIHQLKPASHPDNVVLGGQSSPCSPSLEDHFNEDAFSAICEMLFSPFEEKATVSIVGMPGVGKTTLARRIYASQIAQVYNRAWVTVPQDYNLQHILLELLQSMRPTIQNINKGSDISQLKQQLYKHLGGKEEMYFIVLDNIPNTQAWDEIRECLPHDSNQIRILLTTYHYTVGHYATLQVHEMCALDAHKSWKLFCNRLSHKQHITPEFEEIGRHVVEECEGLPRSIVAVAERLSKCNYTLKEWKKIEKEVEVLGPLYNDAEHLSKLTLIYNLLPQDLKVCFLHFAIYPKVFKINVKRLIRIWIAEGFVRSMRAEELEKKAYRYLDELVRNGLVSISKWEHKMTNVCWMHSSLQNFCIREAKKEGILCAVHTHQDLELSLDMFANSCRWLSLYSHRLDYYTLFSSNNTPRSLFFFHGDHKKLVSFRLLRIVDLYELKNLEGVSFHFMDLVFLRYLSVPDLFEGLDDVVLNNQNLQTLVVRGVGTQLRTPTGHLASRIWELPHLRHLEFGNIYMADPPNMFKEQLQTLSWVIPTHFTEEVYCSLKNLKYLKVLYKDAFEVCKNPNISLDYICYLSKLETLTVIVPMDSVTDIKWPVSLTQLKKLRLSGTNLPIMVLERIGQWQQLQVLKLENAFNNRVWKPTTPFNSLKFLLIEARNLELWEADNHQFPNLMQLVLRHCYCLKEIPFSIELIDTLQTIKLDQCPASVVSSALDIQEKRKKIYGIIQKEGWDFYTLQKVNFRRPTGFITVVINGKIHL